MYTTHMYTTILLPAQLYSVPERFMRILGRESYFGFLNRFRGLNDVVFVGLRDFAMRDSRVQMLMFFVRDVASLDSAFHGSGIGT